MLIALTVYFWIHAALTAAAFLNSYFRPVKVKAKSPTKPEDRVTFGCGYLMLLPLFLALFGVPGAYLQSVALTAFDLPAWVAWAVFGVSVASAVSYTWKQSDTTMSYTPATPHLWGLLIAGYGLYTLWNA